MELIHNTLKNQSGFFPNKENILKFDENGVATVEDEKGKELLSKYEFCLKSKEQFLESKKKAEEPKIIVDTEKVEALESKLNSSNQRINSLIAELNNQKEISEAWKNKYIEVEGKLEAFNKLTDGKGLESVSEGVKTAKNDTPSDETLETQLKEKTKDELIEIAKGMEIKVDGRYNEEKIIELILEKVNA